MLLYNIAIRLYFIVIWLVSFFNEKAKLWINGRKTNDVGQFDKSIWFHFASLGEFEQGRPVLEQLRKLYPADKVIITFFSPSGYEVRKSTKLAEAVYYLPLDTARNAREFIEAIKPKLAIFTKYDYWYHFFNELHKKDIPLYCISGIFRPGQIYFKWCGSFNRKILGLVRFFFVQDERSMLLLQTIGINNVIVSGDTRFDRVWATAQQPTLFSVVNAFKNGQKIFIAGSTWPEDEKLVAALVAEHRDWKFIFAPHEISEEKIKKLIAMLPDRTAIRYSQLAATHHSLYPTYQTLIVDNIGMLSSMYHYGNIAYIGGGFGAGVHNTLEAAAFGLPVIFGPNYAKFKEINDLIGLSAGFSITDEASLKSTAYQLINNDAFYKAAEKNIVDYVKGHTGATETIIDHIQAAIN